jgi:hypothetical protein
MTYLIHTVVPAYFPDEEFAVSSFEEAQLPAASIIKSVESFLCKDDLIDTSGYQKNLARELPRHLGNTLAASNLNRVLPDTRYSPRLKENADLAIQDISSGRKIFFEIEFRPNVEKDLIKFEIGYKCGTLEAAVLILALDRNTINSSYTTMPEFNKFVRIINELRIEYPLLVLGIAGGHI